MPDLAIQVRNLGKRYIISHETQTNLSLRETLTHAGLSVVRRLFANPTPESPQPPRREEFWALRDLDFEIKAGETVAIIGANGAGKSTLLKVLSRITGPTTGRVEINGRVASLLEVGTGFHPELSGRENIFLNGAILGMSRAEVQRKFDAIVAFAEVEKFIDTPVKRYSSGMYTRLAFSVAAHLESEILIIDEVLSVGDAAFQRKSLARMTEIMEAGKTILFVSHNMAAAQKLCRSGIYLNKGRIVSMGPIDEVIAKYGGDPQSAEANINFSLRRKKPELLTILAGSLLRAGQPSQEFFAEEPICFQIQIEAQTPIPFCVELQLRDKYGQSIAFSPGGLQPDQEFTLSPGVSTIEVSWSGLHLAAGFYTVDVALTEPAIRHFDYIQSAFHFEIHAGAIGPRHWNFQQYNDRGAILLPAVARRLA